MDPREITSPDEEMRPETARIEEKQRRGEKLTQRERGVKDAQADVEKGAAKQKEAAREGRLDEWGEERRRALWTDGARTRAADVPQGTGLEVKRIREKQERDEALTRREAGMLGGVARAGDAAER